MIAANMAQKSNKDDAVEYSRKAVMQYCKRVGLTARKTLKRISEGLDAAETKTSYDKDRGKWAYSDPLIDYGARKDYASLAINVLGLKAPDESKVTFPDKDGNPQEIGGAFTSMELATRLVYLVNQAKKQKKLEEDGG